jgi:hypothetical protein
MLANMGIANPVTKGGGKASLYHRQLAQELTSLFAGGALTPTPTALYRTLNPNPNRTVTHC